MARIVQHTAQGSIKINIGNEIKSICACGLSKTFPFCDGSHKATRDEEEGKVYVYHEDGTREEVSQKKE